VNLSEIKSLARGRNLHVSDDILSRYQCVDDAERLDNILRLHERLAIIKARLIRHHPFFATVLLSMDIFFGKTMYGTAETNGKFIRIQPEFMEAISNPEVEGVLVHEIMHVMSLHHLRMRKRHKVVWNMAGDHAINIELMENGFVLPEGGLHDPQYKGQSTEEIYEHVYKDVEFQECVTCVVVSSSESGNSDPGDSTAVPSSDPGTSDDEQDELPGDGGEGDDGGEDDGDAGGGTDDDGSNPDDSTSDDDAGEETEEPWNWGNVLDAGEGLSDAELSHKETETKVMVHQAALSAKNMGCGSDQGIAERIIQCYEDDVEWKEFLRDFVKTSFDKDDYSWSRPNRRHMQSGIYLPQMVGKSMEELVTAIDVSGSIDIAQLNRFGSALSSILMEFPKIEITVLYVDTSIQMVETLTSADLPLKLKTPGGGGTSFIPPFNYVEKHKLDPKCFIYFTDMECGQFPEEPDYPVLWICFVGKTHLNRYKQYYGSSTKEFPPFGELVCMDLPGKS